MILVFGGTTEGRKAVEVLEEAGTPYYYSTKTGEQNITLHHGQRIDGALDATAMLSFCREHDIRLIVNAAHPFASQLHATIAEVAETMLIPVVRYERIYPERDPDIEWIDDYSQVPTDVRSLLATTGVQSIGKLRYLEAQGIKVVYRILNRESSIRLAHEQGVTDEHLCFYPQTVETEAVLMKESGESGGFSEKVKEAKDKGMRILVLKRPELAFRHCVNGPHGLRRIVEKLLPEFYPLHSGLTTGTCATAAAIAATKQLLYGEHPDVVPVLLPNGETIDVAVGYGKGYAYCIKEAGDDPDVTDGIEVRARVENSAHFEIDGGEGVGRFTLPGFDYPPGSPAINKAPR
jgi:cobalt-precorrin-5B (C1)-methyltransferase